MTRLKMFPKIKLIFWAMAIKIITILGAHDAHYKFNFNR